MRAIVFLIGFLKIEKGEDVMPYFKVLRQDLTSVGLLGAIHLQYVIGQWVRPREPLSSHPYKGGGLWVVKTASDAKGIKKYLLRKHDIIARIFICDIGRILYKTSYRVKTSKVRITQEILD